MNREEAFRELESIYSDLGKELERLRPQCDLSGRCCRFKEYGHQLWTTRLEVEYLLEKVGPPEGLPEGVCPFLKNGLCGVRDHRMLGCRIFFCDPSYASAMGPVFERYHRRVKDLHARSGRDYEYFEFLSGLRDRLASRPC